MIHSRLCGSLSRFLAATAVASMALPWVAVAETLAPLPLDPTKVSVSGISSGAFMANQFHIAHSELVMGAGLIAGGLHGCAVLSQTEKDGTLDATISRALDRCMAGRAPLEPAETYAGRVLDLAEHGWIDPVSGLAGDRVYLFTGRADKTVHAGTVERAAEVYGVLGIAEADLALQKFLDPSLVQDGSPGQGGAGHAWLTDDCCQPCPINASPHINNCGYDQAGEILKHIYGGLEDKAEALSGRFATFSQSGFVPDGGGAKHHGLADEGVVYIPAACEPGSPGETCALHMALHGCSQSSEVLGDTFYTKVGLNEWADSNRIVVLYPQAASVELADLDAAYPDRIFRNSIAVNPRGCWNWWGYAYDDRFAHKEGVQIAALRAMIGRLLGE